MFTFIPHSSHKTVGYIGLQCRFSYWYRNHTRMAILALKRTTMANQNRNSESYQRWAPLQFRERLHTCIKANWSTRNTEVLHRSCLHVGNNVEYNIRWWIAIFQRDVSICARVSIPCWLPGWLYSDNHALCLTKKVLPNFVSMTQLSTLHND